MHDWVFLGELGHLYPERPRILLGNFRRVVIAAVDWRNKETVQPEWDKYKGGTITLEVPAIFQERAIDNAIRDVLTANNIWVGWSASKLLPEPPEVAGETGEPVPFYPGGSITTSTKITKAEIAAEEWTPTFRSWWQRATRNWRANHEVGPHLKNLDIAARWYYKPSGGRESPIAPWERSIVVTVEGIPYKVVRNLGRDLAQYLKQESAYVQDFASGAGTLVYYTEAEEPVTREDWIPPEVKEKHPSAVPTELPPKAMQVNIGGVAITVVRNVARGLVQEFKINRAHVLDAETGQGTYVEKNEPMEPGPAPSASPPSGT